MCEIFFTLLKQDLLKVCSKLSVLPSLTIIISGFSTTVLLEALGVKKKILYCNYTFKDIYHIDFEQDIVFDKDENNSLSVELDKLLQVPESDYEKNLSKLMTYYQSFNSEISTRDIIRDKINQLIKSYEV